MSAAKKKIMAALAVFVCLCSAFFFIFAPGFFWGGINYISPDSHVQVVQLTFTRTNVDFSAATVFENSYRVEHELNPQQVNELRRLLRNSWYTRSFRNMHMYSVPLDVDSYHTYFISISNASGRVSLNFGWAGHVLRGGDYNNWVRIRSSGWEEKLIDILNME